MKNVLSSAISSARSENAFVGGVCAPGALSRSTLKRKCSGGAADERERRKRKRGKKRRGKKDAGAGGPRGPGGELRSNRAR